MNRRACVWIGSVLGCALSWRAAGFGMTSPALGQVAPAATAALTPLQTATTVSPAQQSGVIGKFVADQVEQLGSPVPATVTAARAAMIAAVPRAPLPTASYRSAFAAELSAATVKAMSAAATPLSVKVNLGVIVSAVATNSQAVELVPAVHALLIDRQDAVALWGCKAAKPLVIALIQQPSVATRTPLFGDVVASVKTHGRSGLAGFLATEAYRALVVNVFNVPGVDSKNVPPLLKPLYDPVLDLLAVRTQMYADGIVPAPDAEVNVPTFLTTPGVPTTQKQRDRAVQELVDLLDWAGQRAQTVTDPVVLGQLRATLQNAAGALDVFCNNTALSNVVRMPFVITGPVMYQLTQKVHPTVQLSFPRLVKPPTLPPLPPPTAPAGQPGVPGAPATPAAPARP